MNTRIWSTAAVLVLLLSSAVTMTCSGDADARSSISPDTDPIEMVTQVYLDKGDGEIEKFDSDMTTVRSAVNAALGERVDMKANGQINSVDGTANTENKVWVIFVWSSPTGWNAVTKTGDTCPEGTNIAVKYSDKTVVDGKTVYEVPDIEVKYTVHYYLKWEKWTQELSDNKWMRAIYDQVGWESMKEGFWIYGNGSDNNEALANAVYNTFFSDRSLVIDRDTETVTWTVGGEKFFYYGTRDASYGWFLEFLGWSDTKDSGAGGGGYGTWTYWAQYRYDQSGGLDDQNNWGYNQLSFGLYDITVDRVFGLWLQTTSDEPSGTIDLGVPSAIRIDKTVSSETVSEGGKTTETVQKDIVDLMGKSVGSKTIITETGADGSTKTTKTYDDAGHMTSSQTYVRNADGYIVREESVKYVYDDGGKVTGSETETCVITRNGSGDAVTTKKTVTSVSGDRKTVTETDIRHYSGFDISSSITDSDGNTAAISIDLAEGGDVGAAIAEASALKTGTMRNASVSISAHGTFGSADLRTVSDAGIPLTIIGNEGLITVTSEGAGILASAGDAAFELERNLSRPLTDEQYAKVGENAQVFDITMKCDSIEQHAFGKVSITVNYLGKCSSDTLSVWRADGDDLVYVGEASYDPVTGLATFETDHLSRYVLNESVSDGGSDSTILVVAVVAIAAVAAMACVVIVRRKRN